MKPKQREWELATLDSVGTILARNQVTPNDADQIYQLILQALQAQHQQTLEMIEGMKQLTFTEGYIGEDMKRYPSELDCDYNKALDDIIKKIEEA